MGFIINKTPAKPSKISIQLLIVTLSLKKIIPPIVTNIGVAWEIADADDKDINTIETRKNTAEINSEKKRSINAVLFILLSIKDTFIGNDSMKKTKAPTNPTNTSTCETGIDEAKNLFIASLHAKQAIASIIDEIKLEFLLNESYSLVL